MATHDMSILGAMFPDSSGDVYPSTLDIELTMAQSKNTPCMVMEFPTGSDIGLEGSFPIPQNYVGTPVLVIRGVLDIATPTSTLAFKASQVSVADSETVDVAYETADTASNGTWTGYADEEMYEETITLTPASAYVVDDTVFLKFERDNTNDTTSWNFLLTELIFRYSDA